MAGIGLENLEGFNTLVFGSLEFLFRYLPVFLLLFYLAPQKCRSFILFVYSIILYGMAEPYYVLLLLGMTVVNFLFGCGLEADSKEVNTKKRKGWYITAIVCNVLLLAYFKISNAFDEKFLLPIGISFYIFKSISYLTDVYRLDIDAEKSFIRFGAYFCMFPQVVQGPIMRYREALCGLRFDRSSLLRLEDGLKKIVMGLAAKVLIADRLAILWNDIQTIGFESISTPLAWLGAFGYSMQLYFDFAGYSMIAVGIGEMIGLPVVRNFYFPYASVTISEFYRKWHMTLGSWFRDYVYIPLGGNRKGKCGTCINLMIVWILTGIWHGNGWNYLIWGMLLGIFVAIEKLWLSGFLNRFRLFGHLYTLFVIPLTWMVFAIESLDELMIYFLRLFPVLKNETVVNTGDFMKELAVFAPTLILAVIFCIPGVGHWCDRHRRKGWMIAVLLIVFWITVYQITNAVNNPFMYANF